MNHPPRPLRPRRGFTLVELLTVIGIIVVLVSILLPTVGKMRVAASVSSTQAQLVQIGGAIERYHMEHQAFPGAFTAAHYDSNGVLKSGITIEGGGTAAKLTMAETLVLALSGGLKADGTAIPTPLKYDPSLVGRGASSLGPDEARRKRYPAYVEPTVGQLIEPLPAVAADNQNIPGTAPGTPDSVAPEFIDRFQNPRPLLYARANKGGTGITSPASAGSLAQYPAQANKPVTSFVPYVRGPAPDFKKDRDAADNNFPGDFNFDDSWEARHFESMDQYLRHPSIPNTPRRKDSFLLISAGADRTFGTRDDIFYGQ